jgi:ADP-heptose:LPS heptosyltransferase
MRILLIKRGAIGDVLMTTPLLRQLKLNLNLEQLDYCVGEAAASVLVNNSYIDNLIVLPDQTFSIRGSGKFIQFIFSIRNTYDYIFVLGKNWLVNMLCLFSNAKLVGFAREKISRFLLTHYVVYNDINRYQGLYYLDLLTNSGLGVANYNDINLDLPVTLADKAHVDKELQLLGLDNGSKFITLTNSGGNNNFETSGIRMLPFCQVVALLNKLAVNHKVILVGSKVDYANYEAYIANSAYSHNIINLAGKLSISQSCYLLSKSKHFFTTDCGVMHVGLAANIDNKMSGLFGPTNPAHVLPETTQCKIFWQDADIYDKDYQLYGRLRGSYKHFFERLTIDEII